MYDPWRPDDRLAVVDPRPFVANLHEAAAADDDEQRGIGLIAVGRDDRVALEGELGDDRLFVVVNDLPGHALRPRRAIRSAVSGSEAPYLHRSSSWMGAALFSVG